MSVVRKLEAVVERIVEHTDDVRTYVLKPDGRIPRFKPGQFMHLAIDPYDPSRDWPDSRVFSIASAPKADHIRATISRKGRFTSRLFDEVKEGGTVWLKLPYGEFSFKNETGPLVLIAGGTGVAPFISYLEACLMDGRGPDTTLHYGVRSAEHAIYGDILSRCRQELPDFAMTTWVDSGDVDGCRQGRLDVDAIYRETAAPETVYYLSGPWEMIDAFRNALRGLGVAEPNVRIDAWE